MAGTGQAGRKTVEMGSQLAAGQSVWVAAGVGGADQILVGTTVVASFLAGVVALFAPCCVSVMLPAYLATGVKRRRGLIAMTFVFAAGVGAVILPIAFGATALSRVINGQHAIVYSVMAVVMIVMGVAMVVGLRLPIPMVGVRARAARGPGSAFVLGAFSGVATACCAPVLAGVVALSGAAASFLTSLAVGVAYVFGMVAPLFVVALIWDGRELGDSRWLAARTVRLRFRGRVRAVAVSSLAGGLLLIGMGVLVGVLAVNGPDMATRGWQATMSDDAQHYAHVVTTWFGHLPGWVTASGVFAALAGLAVIAVRQAADQPGEEPDATEGSISGNGDLWRSPLEGGVDGARLSAKARPRPGTESAPTGKRG